MESSTIGFILVIVVQSLFWFGIGVIVGRFI